VTNRLEPVDGEWLRVSPRYVVVDFVGMLISGLVLVAATSIPALVTGLAWLWAVPSGLGVLFLVILILTPRRVRAIGYQLRTDDLLFRRGLLSQRFVAVPYGRMQLVDINRGPLDRLVGLSELKLVTAAAASGVSIPGLPQHDADTLRDHLVALAETRRSGL